MSHKLNASTESVPNTTLVRPIANFLSKAPKLISQMCGAERFRQWENGDGTFLCCLRHILFPTEKAKVSELDSSFSLGCGGRHPNLHLRAVEVSQFVHLVPSSNFQSLQTFSGTNSVLGLTSWGSISPCARQSPSSCGEDWAPWAHELDTLWHRQGGVDKATFFERFLSWQLSVEGKSLL
jgi:hypothetical protein